MTTFPTFIIRNYIISVGSNKIIHSVVKTRPSNWFEQLVNGDCRGIVTADVLELGLSRGAIATRKLEGVKWDKEHKGLYWFGPLR